MYACLKNTSIPRILEYNLYSRVYTFVVAAVAGRIWRIDATVEQLCRELLLLPRSTESCAMLAAATRNQHSMPTVFLS